MYAEMVEMKGDINGIKGDVSSLKTDVSSLKSDVSSLKSDVSSLKTDVSSLKTDVSKNSLLLEKLDSNVRLLAEGQESFREQIGRSGNEDKRSIYEKLDIVELAVKSTSSDVMFIKHKVQETEVDVFTIQSHLKIIK